MNKRYRKFFPPKEFRLQDAWGIIGLGPHQDLSGDNKEHKTNLCFAIALTEVDRLDVPGGDRQDAMKAILQAWRSYLDELDDPRSENPEVEYARSFVRVNYPDEEGN